MRAAANIFLEIRNKRTANNTKYKLDRALAHTNTRTQAAVPDTVFFFYFFWNRL